MHREKMTPRRYVFAAIRRTLLAAGILTLLVLALSSQDTGNNVQQGLLLEVSDDLLSLGTGQGFLLFHFRRKVSYARARARIFLADLDHRKIRRITFQGTSILDEP